MDQFKHDMDEYSCALCENRRVVGSKCCCPDDPGSLHCIPEERLRRRVNLEPYEKLCSYHKKKLENGMIFGRKISNECCAPFHVGPAIDKDLRPVPHSWRTYFSRPSQRYRPNQQLCHKCYLLSLEMLHTPDETFYEQGELQRYALSSDLGYTSPRLWASTLGLNRFEDTEGHGGSAWSLMSTPRKDCMSSCSRRRNRKTNRRKLVKALSCQSDPATDAQLDDILGPSGMKLLKKQDKAEVQDVLTDWKLPLNETVDEKDTKSTIDQLSTTIDSKNPYNFGDRDPHIKNSLGELAEAEDNSKLSDEGRVEITYHSPTADLSSKKSFSHTSNGKNLKKTSQEESDRLKVLHEFTNELNKDLFSTEKSRIPKKDELIPHIQDNQFNANEPLVIVNTSAQAKLKNVPIPSSPNATHNQENTETESLFQLDLASKNEVDKSVASSVINDFTLNLSNGTNVAKISIGGSSDLSTENDEAALAVHGNGTVKLEKETDSKSILSEAQNSRTLNSDSLPPNFHYSEMVASPEIARNMVSENFQEIKFLKNQPSEYESTGVVHVVCDSNDDDGSKRELPIKACGSNDSGTVNLEFTTPKHEMHVLTSTDAESNSSSKESNPDGSTSNVEFPCHDEKLGLKPNEITRDIKVDLDFPTVLNNSEPTEENYVKQSFPDISLNIEIPAMICTSPPQSPSEIPSMDKSNTKRKNSATSISSETSPEEPFGKLTATSPQMDSTGNDFCLPSDENPVRNLSSSEILLENATARACDFDNEKETLLFEHDEIEDTNACKEISLSHEGSVSKAGRVTDEDFINLHSHGSNVISAQDCNERLNNCITDKDRFTFMSLYIKIIHTDTEKNSRSVDSVYEEAEDDGDSPDDNQSHTKERFRKQNLHSNSERQNAKCLEQSSDSTSSRTAKNPVSSPVIYQEPRDSSILYEPQQEESTKSMPRIQRELETKEEEKEERMQALSLPSINGASETFLYELRPSMAAQCTKSSCENDVPSQHENIDVEDKISSREAEMIPENIPGLRREKRKTNDSETNKRYKEDQHVVGNATSLRRRKKASILTYQQSLDMSKPSEPDENLIEKLEISKNLGESENDRTVLPGVSNKVTNDFRENIPAEILDTDTYDKLHGRKIDDSGSEESMNQDYSDARPSSSSDSEKEQQHLGSQEEIVIGLRRKMLTSRAQSLDSLEKEDLHYDNPDSDILQQFDQSDLPAPSRRSLWRETRRKFGATFQGHGLTGLHEGSFTGNPTFDNDNYAGGKQRCPPPHNPENESEDEDASSVFSSITETIKSLPKRNVIDQTSNRSDVMYWILLLSLGIVSVMGISMLIVFFTW